MRPVHDVCNIVNISGRFLKHVARQKAMGRSQGRPDLARGKISSPATMASIRGPEIVGYALLTKMQYCITC
jgi:hypothetical protein